MADSPPFHILHGLREEPLIDGSPRVTKALAILEAADPEPVTAKAFREAFGCTASETSHVLGRLRALGLVVREGKEGSYRLSFMAQGTRDRIARKLAGHDLPDLGPIESPAGDQDA